MLACVQSAHCCFAGNLSASVRTPALLPVALFALLSLTACTQAQTFCDSADITCNPLAAVLYLSADEPECLVRGEVPANGWTFFSGEASDDSLGFSACGLSDGSTILSGTATAADTLAQGQSPLLPFQGAAGDINGVSYRVNASGVLDRWTHFGQAGVSVSLTAVTEAPDGGFYIAATVGGGAGVTSINGLAPLVGFQGGGSDIALIRYGADLQPVWYRYLGGAGAPDSVGGVTATPDGGVGVVGISVGTFTQDGQSPLQPYSAVQDGVVFRVDSAGALEWCSFFGGGGSDLFTDVGRVPNASFVNIPLESGERYVVVVQSNADVPSYAGLTPRRSYNGGTDVALLEFDGAGNVSEYSFFGSAGDENGPRLQASRSGDLYISSTATANIPFFEGEPALNAFAGGSSDIWLLRLDAARSLVSHRFLGTASFEGTAALAETGTGELVIGTSMAAGPNFGVEPRFPNSGGQDLALIRIGGDDVIQAFSYYGAANGEVNNAIAGTSDGGAILVGETAGPTFTPAGSTLLEGYSGALDEIYLRVFSDGSVAR